MRTACRRRRVLELQINEFGQIPLQLFAAPHPRRLPGAASRPLLREEELPAAIAVAAAAAVSAEWGDRDGVESGGAGAGSGGGGGGAAAGGGEAALGLEASALSSPRLVRRFDLGATPLTCVVGRPRRGEALDAVTPR